ncbi:MAG: SMEK domain-containing protein [Candidatus Aminicenantes bacterium]|nr:SMEK domain-containing protein [Candidatus Aminicenantes bacterium]
MFNRENKIKRIIEKLTILQYYLENVSSINLNDGNLIAENFSAGLLNKLFDWNLKNLNTTGNEVGIDLGDSLNKVAVQVTRQNKRQKIEETIQKFFTHEHHKKYKTLYVFLLTNKKLYRKPFKTIQSFHFTVEENIIDFKDIIARINSLSNTNLNKIAEYFDEELSKFNWKKEAEKAANFINSQHQLNSPHRGAMNWDNGITAVFGNDGFGNIEDEKVPHRRQVDILRLVLKHNDYRELSFGLSDNKSTWVMLVDSSDDEELSKHIWSCFFVALEEKTNKSDFK